MSRSSKPLEEEVKDLDEKCDCHFRTNLHRRSLRGRETPDSPYGVLKYDCSLTPKVGQYSSHNMVETSYEKECEPEQCPLWKTYKMLQDTYRDQ